MNFPSYSKNKWTLVYIFRGRLHSPLGDMEGKIPQYLSVCLVVPGKNSKIGVGWVGNRKKIQKSGWGGSGTRKKFENRGGGGAGAQNFLECRSLLFTHILVKCKSIVVKIMAIFLQSCLSQNIDFLLRAGRAQFKTSPFRFPVSPLNFINSNFLAVFFW